MLTHRYTLPTRHLLPFLSLTIFLVQIGLSLSALPSMKLMQDAICKTHLGLPITDALLPEKECHGEDVQRELNLVDTGILVSATIGGALVAFPMGLLADRFGRVPILTLSILGMFLSSTYSILILWKAEVSVRALWGTGAWLLVGGGRSVAEAMVFTIISDVVPERRRATWLQCVVAAVIAAQILGPLLSRELIKASIWTPLWLSLGLILLGGLITALFTPETLYSKTTIFAEERYDTPSTRATLRCLLTKPSICLLPAATLTIPLASTEAELITRLMPLAFTWTFSNSTLLLVLSSCITLIALLVLVPGVSYLLRHKNIIHRDAYLLQGSAFLLVLGSLLYMMITHPRFIIAGVVITALGSGIPTLSRALLVSFLPSERHTGSLFGVLAVGEILGFLVCQLGMGVLFDVGLLTWTGLPFGMGMVIALIIGVPVWMVRMPKVVKDEEDPTDIDGETASQTSGHERYELYIAKI